MAPPLRRQAVQPVIQEVQLPAPMGGINSISAASAMPATDALRMWNLFPSELGLRVRMGEREWLTGLTGSADNYVRTTIGYSGSTADKDRLFVTTSTGIWNVTTSREKWTSSTAYVVGDIVLNGAHVYICDTNGTSGSSGGPTGTGTNISDGTTRWDYVSTARVIDFATTTGDAGRGVSHAFVTSGGHFLLYCDEVNGLYIYTESTDTWAAAVSGTTQAWAASTTYLVGDKVINGSNEYICDTDGISAASGGPTGTGTNIADNTTRWDYVGAATANAIGPSLADQRLGLTADPGDFVFGGVFKSRVWFAERDSARAWYLAAGNVYGTATSFNLATKFRAGGYLVGFWNWTYDGGSGIDDSLVAVSSGGDVAIYQGTDPASASTFGLKGVWSIGAPPAGRRIATAMGGDVLLLSRAGLIPLSVLVQSGAVDRSQYATAKIWPLFNQIMVGKADLDGWSIHLHPEENALLITVPTVEGSETEQLIMSLANKGWGRLRGLPILSCDTWQGKLYFGTTDGRVEINDGYTDGRTLLDPNGYEEIEWALITAFSSFGNARRKQFRMCRTTFISDGGSPRFKVAARYKYDFNEAGAPDAVTATGNTWDSGEWDDALWGGEYASTQAVRGLSGAGVEAALALTGKSTVKTVLVGFDVFFIQGGQL
jgi:hypothetical protein